MTLSLLLLVTATWLRRTVPLVMVWTAAFVMARLVQRWLVDGLGMAPEWRLLDIWNDMYLFGQWVFGKEHELLRPLSQPQPAYWKATVVMVAVCGVCACTCGGGCGRWRWWRRGGFTAADLFGW